MVFELLRQFMGLQVLQLLPLHCTLTDAMRVRRVLLWICRANLRIHPRLLPLNCTLTGVVGVCQIVTLPRCHASTPPSCGAVGVRVRGVGVHVCCVCVLCVCTPSLAQSSRWLGGDSNRAQSSACGGGGRGFLIVEIYFRSPGGIGQISPCCCRSRHSCFTPSS